MPSDTRSYAVGTGPVTLTVVIGGGQLGTTGVRVDGAFLQPGRDGVYALGRGAALAGKTVEVVSAVNQTNASSPRMFVTYELAGGPAPLTLEQEDAATQPGQMIFFEATFPLETAP